MKIGKRLGFGFGAVVVLLLGMTAAALWSLSSLNALKGDLAKQYERTLLATQTATDTRDAMLYTSALLLSRDPAKKAEMKSQIGIVREAYSKKMEHLKSTIDSVEAKRLMEEMSGHILNWRQSNNQAIEFSEKHNDEEAAALVLNQSFPAYTRVIGNVASLAGIWADHVKEINDHVDSIYQKVRWTLSGAGVFAVFLAGMFGILITRSITIPVDRSSRHLQEMAKGDFSITIAQADKQRKDETGDLARSVDILTENMRSIVSDLNGSVQTLASSSTELSTISSQVSSGTRDMSNKAGTVAAAAEESSANTNSVAASMEQTTTNLSSVASATEQMSATIGEIASNSEKARNISHDATEQAQAVSTVMKELGRAAQEIGQVTETITSISAQTNLLALNATIEAARAGSAGKGFAVVANEIKELAQQTATATEDIKARISGIQASTGDAIRDIDRIAQVIRDVGEIVSTIAVAIEEQSVVTRDIASNIAQASFGVKDSNERIAQTATVTQAIAQDIALVNSTIGDISLGGEQVQSSAAELSRLSEQLRDMVGRFRV